MVEFKSGAEGWYVKEDVVFADMCENLNANLQQHNVSSNQNQNQMIK